MTVGFDTGVFLRKASSKDTIEFLIHGFAMSEKPMEDLVEKNETRLRKRPKGKYWKDGACARGKTIKGGTFSRRRPCRFS